MINIPKTYLFVFFLLTLQILLLANLQFTAWPEMFSYAYFKNNGFLLYNDMIQPYPPLLPIFLANLFKIFSYRVEVLMATTWFLALACSTVVFKLSEKLTKSTNTALLTLFLYSVLQPFLDGNMLWFDTAIVLPVALGALFAFDKKLFFSGLCFAVATATKQTAAIFPLIFVVLLLIQKEKLLKILSFLTAPALFGIVVLLRVMQEGQLEKFWKWTFLYPATKWSDFPGYVVLKPSTYEIATLVILVIPVAILLFLKRLEFKNKQNLFHRNENTLLLFLFLVAGVVGIYPRFSFFHFQAALVFFVLIYGIALSNLKKTAHKALSILVFFALLWPPLFRPNLTFNWQKEPRFYTEDDMQTAQKIKEIVEKHESVYLLGLDSSLYAFSQRVPPKPWIDNFGWYLEIEGVQEEVLSRWENSPPTYIFWKNPKQGNWFDLGTYQPQKIAEWIKARYTRRQEVKPNVWVWKLD